MEPEVHIIEKYFQVVLNCLTMANVKFSRGNKEIDLLAMNPKTQESFHVEARVTRTGSKQPFKEPTKVLRELQPLVLSFI